MRRLLHILILGLSLLVAGDHVNGQPPMKLNGQQLSVLPLQAQSSPWQGESRPVARNVRILGPTGELLPPLMAGAQLGGQDYFEWCLRWNKRQRRLAADRAVPPRTVSGWVTDRQAYSQSMRTGGFYSGSRSRGSLSSTTNSRQQEWLLGGYGGGPLSIYNPFVPPSSVSPRHVGP